MSDNGPRELAIDLVWRDGRLSILVVHGDRPLHSDTLDPRSATSRARAIKKLQIKLPAIDVAELEQRLIEEGAKGPPPDAESPAGAVSAVDPDPEPWGDQVDGAALLTEIVNVLGRFIVLPVHGASVVALWVLHSFVFACFEYTPRLLIHSPVMRCGKTRFLRLISALVSRPLACEGITGPALFRSIEKFRPTMLIDEADTMLRGKETSEVLRGVINSGHQRGGKVIRCSGDESEPRTFDVFAPVVIAMIGKPPATIEDRSIPITMRRRMPGEKVERYKPGVSLRLQFSALVEKCVRWAKDNTSQLRGARPSIPAGIDDRAADCWFALFAIADSVGGSWPEHAREIAVDVMSAREKTEGLGVELLRDIKTVFDKVDLDRLSTSSLITALVQMEERPWPDYRRGQPISARNLATLLAAFEISSRNVRLSDGTVPKGYLRADFEDAWARYFPVDPEPPPAGSATTLHAFPDKDLGQNPSATEETTVADESGCNPLENKGCSAVADPAGGCTGKDSYTAPTSPMEQLLDLVAEMAAEVDAAPAGMAPFTGAALTAYYQDGVNRYGVDATLADARVRYALQLQGTFLPLQGGRS